MLEVVRKIWFGESTTFIEVCYGIVYVDGEGGQLGDRGTVDGHRIISITKASESSIIEVEGRIDRNVGESVVVEIDTQRRRDIAIQHTTQHLLSAIFESELGSQTVGFQMSEDYSTIDLELSLLSDEMISLVEKKANQCVEEKRKVIIDEVDRETAIKLDLRKAVSEKIVGTGSNIRVVTIDGIDRSACGGFHVGDTGEIRLIKIIKREKVKGRLTRIFFIAGGRAVEDYSRKHDLVSSVSQSLSCSYLDLPERIGSLVADIKAFSSKFRKLSERLAERIAGSLRLSPEGLIFLEDEEEIILSIPKFLSFEKYLFVGRAGEKVFLASKGFDCSHFVQTLKEELSIKGGGGKERAQLVYSGDSALLRDIIEVRIKNEHKAGE